MFLTDNEEARNALVEKLNAFDEEIVKFSVEYKVNHKEIISLLAYAYLVKILYLLNVDDDEIGKVAQDVLSKKDIN